MNAMYLSLSPKKKIHSTIENKSTRNRQPPLVSLVVSFIDESPAVNHFGDALMTLIQEVHACVTEGGPSQNEY